jgi:hypothetical protein
MLILSQIHERKASFSEYLEYVDLNAGVRVLHIRGQLGTDMCVH